MKGFAKFTAGLAGLMLLAGIALPANAEVNPLRVSKGYGIAYLPFMVMEHDHLLQKHLKAAGLGHTKVSWVTLDGGNNINDAMLSGALDFASIGVPGFVMLWDRTLHTPREISGVAAVGESAGYLDTMNDPREWFAASVSLPACRCQRTPAVALAGRLRYFKKWTGSAALYIIKHYARPATGPQHGERRLLRGESGAAIQRIT